MNRVLLTIFLLAAAASLPSKASAGKFSEAIKFGSKIAGAQAGRAGTRKVTQTVAKQVASRASAEAARATARRTSAAAVRYFGDDAIKAGGKLAGNAGRLTQEFTRVTSRLSAQNQRRLLMLAPDLQKSGQTAKALGLLSKGGAADKVMETLWRHRGKIAAGVAVTGLVVHGDDIVESGSKHVVGPLAEAAAKSIVPAVAEPVRIAAFLALAAGTAMFAFLGLKACGYASLIKSAMRV